MPVEPRLWVVRHADTEWSAAGRHTGRTDVPLTTDGERRARQLRDLLSRTAFGLVLTSPLQRARRTAELAGFPDATVDADAPEWDYGDYEGLTTEQIREQVPDWTIWRYGAPGGESPADVAARASRVVVEVLRAGVPDALLFSHGHFLRALATAWLEQPVDQGARYALGPASVSVLGWEHGARVVWHWNDPGAE